jgi:chemotaxis protein CheD
MHKTSRFPALRLGDVFLSPGDLHAGFAPGRVWTILGSCVSVVIWHKRLKFGGMTHYLLPERPDSRQAGGGAPDPRYGVDSCKLLLAAMGRAGVSPEQCVARLFGGSHMLISGKPGPSTNAIGHRNAAIAHEFIEQHGIRLLSESLLGDGHRRIFFDIGTGRVWESRARDGSREPEYRKSECQA